MKKNTKIFFVSAVLLTLLIVSSGCSAITGMTDSFKSINIQAQAPVQKVNYDYQSGGGAAAPEVNATPTVTVNVTPTEIPRFVYV